MKRLFKENYLFDDYKHVNTGILNKELIDKLDSLMLKIDKMKLSSLVVLIAIPFTPAFAINIAAALSKIDFKKFLIAILIGKVSLVAFWGFIGTSLVESLKNPKITILILLMLLISYFISKFVTKKLDIK